MGYQGLPQRTLAFLAGLEAANDRDWFQAHRAEYDRDWLTAGLDLVAALSRPCADLGLLAVPRLNASLRRIHRDVRFARDKRPYEPRLHLILSAGAGFKRGPGVHLVIGAGGIGYGAGVYGLEAGALERFRQRVCAADGRAEFEAVLAEAGQVGAGQVGAVLDAPDLARVPRGYVAAPWDHLIRRKSVIVRTQPEAAHPDWLQGPGAVEGWMGIVRSLVPLVRWLGPITAA